MNKILEELVGKTQEILGDGWEVKSTPKMKNNGCTENAVSIRKAEDNIAPCITVDRALERIQKGEQTVEEAAEELAKMAGTVEVPNFKVPSTREEVLASIIPYAMNKEKNEDQLEDIPHIVVEDLAIGFRLTMENGTAVIRNNLAEKYELTVDDLVESALNTVRGNASTKGMSQVIAEMTGNNIGFDNDGEEKMYVVGNNRGLFGAGQIVNKELFDDFYEKHGSYFVLPSSIHELLFVLDEGEDVRGLKDMVREVNDTQVEEKDRLSYNVYRYSKESGLVIAD